MSDDRQIVSDKYVGQVELVLEVLHQVDHLGLDRYVQRTDGFVRNDDARVRGQGAGDSDSLALASREFMGVAVGLFLGQTHLVQQPDHLVLSFLGRVFCMDLQRFLDNLTDGHSGVEGGIGVLEDHLNVGTVGAHCPAIELVEIDDALG